MIASSSSAASSSSLSCAYSSSSFSFSSHYQLVSRSPHPLRHRFRFEPQTVEQSEGWGEETRTRNSGRIGRKRNGWDWNNPFGLGWDQLVWGFGSKQKGAKEKGVYGNGWIMRKRVGFGSRGAASAELKTPLERRWICRISIHLRGVTFFIDLGFWKGKKRREEIGPATLFSANAILCIEKFKN